MTVVNVLLSLVASVLLIRFGRSLLKDRRRNAALRSEILIAITIAQLIVNVMLNGIGYHLIQPAAQLVILTVISVTIDPTLRDERELQARLRVLDDRRAAEEGMLGRDETGEGYIKLNFFNLFWVFMVCSVLGLVLEIIWHMTVVDPGVYQDRAGLLFGPFSPIYGVGAVLMTIFLNRFHKSNWLVIFLVAAVIGGAFEAFVSLFMQYAFGAVAWDYSNMPGSLFGGRTCLPFMACWGLLGVVWIKLLLPFMLRLVNFIPWNWRYMLTTVAACFMLVDAVMTLQALDCWYMRLSHDPVDTPLQQFYDHEFGDAYMADRFQSMTIVPSDAVRG